MSRGHTHVLLGRSLLGFEAGMSVNYSTVSGNYYSASSDYGVRSEIHEHMSPMDETEATEGMSA